ncbi:MAG: histidine phosphatase family protein [Bacteroides sp.]|nr:histidine phosphatase family protein [Bacteroides sp.]MBD5359039.1 histidine phosphatase family protein [Bacteroides sp.]
MKAHLHSSMLFGFLMVWLISLQSCNNNSQIVWCPETVWSFPLELNGTMMAYDFKNSDTVVPWSNDMKPIFINYMARHGARYLSSEKKVERLRSELTEAAQKGNLTKAGEEFLTVIQMTDSVTAGNWGALNIVGMEEEQRLGKEMYSIAPSLLKSGKIEARATYVPRVVMTMYELCHELARSSSDIEISTMEGKQYNPLLRYFKVDSDYANYIENGPWKKTYDEYASHTIPVTPAAKLFHTSPDDKKLRELVMDMYGVLQSLPASGLYAPVKEWFSQEEYTDCWKVDNLQHYYQRSISKFSDIAARSATPLLNDIIESADQAIAGKSSLAASLRFGHAETVIPLFALMRLPGCYAPDCTAENTAENWKDWEVSPLGANLLMVLLKDSKGNINVALRLNGKWVDTDGEKIIPWSKMKTLWQSYMQE